ncbi:CDP-alcohol phosphatidyltransferase family protein [archaeon]|nr:CDP-alcohol phosphatidyltransferase family protein [archaeon]
MKDKEIRTALKSYSETTGKLFGTFISPNQMTMITLLFGLASALMIFLREDYLAITFFVLSCLADWIDGAIAKATGKVTAFGGALDSIVDKSAELAIYIGIALRSPMFLFPAFIAASAMMWSSYTNQRCKSIGLEEGIGFMQRKERAALLSVCLLLFAFTIGTSYIVSFLLYAIALFSFLTGMHRVYLAYRRSV